MLWGAENVFYRFGQGGGFLSNAIYRLYYKPELANTILILHVVSCLLALLPHSFAAPPRVVAWVTALMLYAAAPSAYGWTMPLLLNISAVSIGLCLKSDWLDLLGFRYWLHQLLRAQSLVWIIGFAAMAWGNDQWQRGEAFYYAIHHDAAVRHWVLDSRTWLSRLSIAVSYAVLCYATLLPVVLLLNRLRSTAITVGIVLLFGYSLVFTNIMNAAVIGLLLLPWAVALPKRSIAA